MRATLAPFSFVVISIAGWMNQHQQHVIEYLIEENRFFGGLWAGRCRASPEITFQRSSSPGCFR
jgi:hypothetical protein